MRMIVMIVMIVSGTRWFRARLPGDSPAAAQRQRGDGDGDSDQQIGPGTAGAEYTQRSASAARLPMASLREHNYTLRMFASPSRNAYNNQATARFTINASIPTTPMVAGPGAAPYHYGPSAMANIRTAGAASCTNWWPRPTTRHVRVTSRCLAERTPELRSAGYEDARADHGTLTRSMPFQAGHGSAARALICP